jgi:hypothetical protein
MASCSVPSSPSANGTDNLEISTRNQLLILRKVHEDDIVQLTLKLARIRTTRTHDEEREDVLSELNNLRKTVAELSETLKMLGSESTSSIPPASCEEDAPPRSNTKQSKLPGGLPKFHTDSHDFPAQFIKRLELMLRSANYPENQWAQALAVQVRGSGAAWVMRTLADENDWHVAKMKFMQHFDHPDQKFINRQRLYNMRQRGDESIRQFSDRFGNLVEELGENDESEQLLTLFFNGLKKEIMPHYRVAILNNTPTNLSQAYSIAQAVEAALNVGQKSLVHDNSDRKITLPYKGHERNNMRNPRSPVPTPVRCNYCQRLGHQESQCRQKQKHIVRDENSIICYKCHKTGHIAPNCPTKSKDKLGENKYEGTPNKDSKLRVSRTNKLHSDDQNLTLWLGDETTPKMRTSTDQDMTSKELRIQVLINNKIVPAIIDTGCTNSVMDDRLAVELRLQVKPVSIKIQLGGENCNIQTSGVAENLLIRHGGYQIQKGSILLAILAEKVVYLGMDLLSKLGIGITDTFTCNSQGSIPMSVIEDEELLSEPAKWPDEDQIELFERSKLAKEIQSVIDANKQLKVGELYKHPAAIIKIETDNSMPIYRR